MAKPGKPDPSGVDAAMARARKAAGKKAKDELKPGAASALLRPPSLWVSTGSLALDRLVRGVNPGGFPLGPTGRVVHLAGEWSTGKSLMADHLMKSVIEAGGIGYVSETEATRDPQFAERIGLDLSRVEVHPAGRLTVMWDTFAEYHRHIREALGPNLPLLWVIDSLDASRSDKAVGKGMADGGGWMMGGGKSEALGEMLRRFTDECASRYPTSLVLLNQTRVDPMAMFGTKKYTPGGQAPHFYASVEIQLAISPLGAVRDEYRGAKLSKDARKRLGLPVTEKGDMIGRWIRARITKNKTGGPFFVDTDFFLSFTHGISYGAGLLQRLLVEGVIDLEGTKVTHHFPGGTFEEFETEADWAAWVLSNQEKALGYTAKELRG